MYSAKNRDANFILPIAKRQVMFSEDAYLEEGGPFDPSTLPKEYLENLGLIYLRIFTILYIICEGKSNDNFSEAYKKVAYPN